MPEKSQTNVRNWWTRLSTVDLQSGILLRILGISEFRQVKEGIILSNWNRESGSRRKKGREEKPNFRMKNLSPRHPLSQPNPLNLSTMIINLLRLKILLLNKMQIYKSNKVEKENKKPRELGMNYPKRWHGVFCELR